MEMNPYERIRDELVKAVDQVYHYFAMDAEPPYAVWAEERGNQLWSDNKPSGRIHEGTADYFTREESDPAVPRIEEALTLADSSWRLNSIQFEEETGLIHYEWVWEVV